MSRDLRFASVLVVTFGLVGAFLAVVFVPFIDARPLPGEVMAPAGEPTLLPTAHYLPPTAEDAPPALREAVTRGRALLERTGALLPAQEGRALRCASCHFEAGRTPGGKNGSFSLVGASARYPRPGPGGALLDLPGRVNRCLTVNMGGRPLAPDAPEMRAILAWLGWLGRGVPQYAEVPWVGVAPLETAKAPDADHGKEVFTQRCAMCHGADGAGTEVAPPLFGPRAFTRASALNAPRLLSAFVLLNMPREAPILAEDEAVDVAAYVLSQPRPEGPTP